MQVLDFYMVPTGGMAARFEDGEIRALSKCEALSILQQEALPKSPDVRVRDEVCASKRSVVKITTTRQSIYLTQPLRRVA